VLDFKNRSGVWCVNQGASRHGREGCICP
jgi:hypothetical protein